MMTPMSVPYFLVGILGLALLMVVHEAGHFLVARRSGMRVTKFSIGFGPTIFRHQPKGSPTTYQIGIVPFLAYVQIAGLNPYEEIDPKDPQSYANASLGARIATIAAGPLANYLFASVLMFFGFLLGGVPDETSLRVTPTPGGPAAVAGIQSGDRILAIDDAEVRSWEDLVKAVSAHGGEPIAIKVERDGTNLTLHPTPKLSEKEKRALIQIAPYREPVGIGRAAKLSLIQPAMVVAEVVKSLSRPQFVGPVTIVKETAAAAENGAHVYLKLLGIISASLAAFNLLPLPALDGGRLLFLGYEAVSRRRPDSKVEAKVHAVGILMFLTLMVLVTYSEIFRKH